MEKDKPEGATSRGRSAEEGTTEASLNMSELRELADLVDEHGFTDFEFENEKIRVRLSKAVPQAVVQPVPQYAPPPIAAPPAQSAGDAADAAPAAVTEWLIGEEEPSRPHPLIVGSPNVALGESEDVALLLAAL